MSLVRFRFWAFRRRRKPTASHIRGCSSMVEHQPSKLDTWVRFPSPALFFKTSKYARVAQRWSTSLPRRGSRVRFPSRALKKVSCRILFLLLFFGVLLYSPCLMYRRRRSCCLTLLPVSSPRPFSVIFLLPTGTDDHFSSPVPGRRFIFRFPRVQMTSFPLLYPADAFFTASQGYR